MFNLSKTLKRIVSVSAAAVCLITGVHFTPDSEKVTADAASGMNAFEITQDMKIGWNLGNSLDATRRLRLHRSQNRNLVGQSENHKGHDRYGKG